MTVDGLSEGNGVSVSKRNCAKGKRLGSSRGQAYAEFALVATAFLMILFAIINFARAVYAYSFVSYAAREGTRYAIVHGGNGPTPPGMATASDVQSFVANELHGLDPSKLTVNTTWSDPGNESAGSTVTVQVEYDFAFSSPFLPPMTFPLKASSQMVISQ